MCGLTFTYASGVGEPLTLATQRALLCMQYRGPDERAVSSGDDYALGHVRLSIVDLSGSHQPMLDPSGRYALVFNGEIYNYQELRRDLSGAWQFVESGDTEVILAGLILHGLNFVARLEGMFAFVFWDRDTRTLWAARDRMGKKPLYLLDRGSQIQIASELPALRALASDYDWREDFATTADYFRYGYCLPGHTFYEGVKELLPAHVAEWQPNKPLKLSRYWTLPERTWSGSLDDAIDGVRESVIAAVKKRLLADVEVGAFLSGGVDSSLVSAIANQYAPGRLQTFTIGFEEQSYDERPFARQVATLLGTQHHESVLSSWHAEELSAMVLDHVGQPFFDSSLLPTAAVSRETAKHVKVALSGDGGDELFCGYQRYVARTILRSYSRVPRPLRIGIAAFVRALPEPFAHHSRSLLKKAHLFLDVLQRYHDEQPYVAPLMYSKAEFGALLPGIADLGHGFDLPMPEGNHDEIAAMMVADAQVYLPQDIMTKVDRASMAYSLESRAPLLDRDVVEWAFRLPLAWHLHRGKGKQMLLRAFAPQLPDSIWHRRKQGFAVPIHDWMRGQLGVELEALLKREGHPLDLQTVTSLLAQHRAGVRDHGNRLWAIYIYLLWRSRR